MRLPNGYGGVVKLSGARRRPYAARITTGWYYNDQTGKRVQRYQILGYAATRAEALQILAHYNDYPIDGASLKLTFADIYERWYNDCSACEYLIHTMVIESAIDVPTDKYLKALISESNLTKLSYGNNKPSLVINNDGRRTTIRV